MTKEMLSEMKVGQEVMWRHRYPAWMSPGDAQVFWRKGGEEVTPQSIFENRVRIVYVQPDGCFASVQSQEPYTKGTPLPTWTDTAWPEELSLIPAEQEADDGKENN